MLENLASYRHTVDRIRSNWSAFLEKRRERLIQQDRHGTAAEKVAENILEDMLTMVLGWSLSDVNNQVGYADLLLTRLGIKYLIIEAKRPGALAWNRLAVEAALEQARRYAAEQKVQCIAVSDGVMLYAADIQHGGLTDRLFVSLDAEDPPEALWWLSEHGIYRPRTNAEDAALRLLPECEARRETEAGLPDDVLLHPKYKLPARCFAYARNAAEPKTWKLPYRLADGRVDVKRLPKAVQAILSNYRGTKVSGIDEKDVPDVLVTLARAAASLGKMPHQCGEAAEVYMQLARVLEQLGRSAELTPP
jgi:hypothetical protein